MLWLALERDGKILVSTSGTREMISHAVKIDGMKTEETLSSGHSLIQEAKRGDTINIMKTIESSSTEKKKTAKKTFFGGGNSASLVPENFAQIENFKLEITILPDSISKISAKYIEQVCCNL